MMNRIIWKDNSVAFEEMNFDQLKSGVQHEKRTVAAWYM
jgi:hypothetical protein